MVKGCQAALCLSKMWPCMTLVENRAVDLFFASD